MQKIQKFISRLLKESSYDITIVLRKSEGDFQGVLFFEKEKVR